MNKKRAIYICLLLSVVLSTASGICQGSKPDSASSILSQALQQARTSHKNVFLIFHASWCKWCKKLDTLLEQPDISKMIEESYVVTRVDVLEQGEKKQTIENPGAFETLKDLDGEKSGLPYYVFIDENGKTIGNSNAMPDSQNIGYPGSKEEDSTFVALLRRTARNMTDDQSEVIQKYLERASPH